WQPFRERLAAAEEILDEAARLKPPDVCVYSTLMQISKPAEWDRQKMDRTLELGLKVSKKNLALVDTMTGSLLPRWGRAPGDLGEFAAQGSELIEGPDGLNAYMRVVRLAHVAEINLKRSAQGEELSPNAYRDFTDPTVVLDEFPAARLKAAIPVARERHPKSR